MSLKNLYADLNSSKIIHCASITRNNLQKNRVLYYENFSVVVLFIILIIKYSFFSFLLINELIQGSIKETMMYRFPHVTGNPSW